MERRALSAWGLGKHVGTYLYISIYSISRLQWCKLSYLSSLLKYSTLEREPRLGFLPFNVGTPFWVVFAMYSIYIATGHKYGCQLLHWILQLMHLTENGVDFGRNPKMADLSKHPHTFCIIFSFRNVQVRIQKTILEIFLGICLLRISQKIHSIPFEMHWLNPLISSNHTLV